MALPDLITAGYASQALAVIAPNPAQQAFQPYSVTAASMAVRSWCRRSFTQGTYIEEVPIVDGIIRLRETPIGVVQRIQAWPSQVLTVSNGTANAAWIYLQATGDASVWSPLVITGMVLNWESGGVLSSSTIVYSALSDQRISTLASAIAAVGSGWTASADPILGVLPVSEIMDGVASKGAGPNDLPSGTAVYHAYGQSITNARFLADDGQNTGMVYVGRQARSLAAQWGPGGEELFGDQPYNREGRVKATYTGGFATIPDEIQLATAELVKMQLMRLRQDDMLASEDAADYSYATIGAEQVMALPRHVLQGLVRWKNVNA